MICTLGIKVEKGEKDRARETKNERRFFFVLFQATTKEGKRERLSLFFLFVLLGCDVASPRVTTSEEVLMNLFAMSILLDVVPQCVEKKENARVWKNSACSSRIARGVISLSARGLKER